MRISLLIAVAAAVTGAVLWAADWPTTAGGPQRNGWARSERLIEKSNVGQLQLLYKYQADNALPGLGALTSALTSPIVIGNLITYVGFKEMLIFGASSDKVFSIDADVNKQIWVSNLEPQGKPDAQASNACPGGLTAPVVMAGSSSTSRHFAISPVVSTPAGTPPVPAVRRSAYDPPLSQTLSPLTPTTLSRLAALYTVSSDGLLRILNSSTGQDLISPIKFVPPNAKVTSLNVQDNVVYATTSEDCDGHGNGVFAVDLLSADRKVASFMPPEGGFSGAGGTTIGNDGTVYVQVMYAPDGASGHPKEAIVSLTAKDLSVKDYVTLSDKPIDKNLVHATGITPLVFSLTGRDVLLAGGRDGRLYLLDSKSLGGADHHTPLFASEVLAPADKKDAGYGFRGTFTTWVDTTTGLRWFYAPVAGPLSSKVKLPTPAGKPTKGSLLSFTLAEVEGKPSLQNNWLSEEMELPTSPVSANGMVFVLATGESSRLAKQNGTPYSVSEWRAMSSHAKLFVLDAITGKELYSSGDAAAASSHNGGLAVANGRVYFTAQDNAVYCFGLLKGQSQLSEQH